MDESGLSLFDVLWEDLTAFARDAGVPEAFGTVTRVAVTEEQVARYDLPTNPGKPVRSDRNGRRHTPPGCTMAVSVQAEALDPAVLVAEVDGWLRTIVDVDLLNETLAESNAERSIAVAALEDARNLLEGDV